MKQETDVLRVPSFPKPDPKKVPKKLSITRQILESIATVGIMLGAFYVLTETGVIQLPEEEKRKEVVPYSKLLKQARSKSIGEDRIWTDQEKRKFLDSNGLEEAILQEGQAIHFKINKRINSHGGIFDYTERVYVYTDGNYIGKIPRSKLQAYVNSE